MQNASICAALLLLAIAASSSLSSNTDNCNLDDIKRCDPVIFYGLEKGIIFTDDETLYQERCSKQLNCVDTLRCFIQGQLPKNGTEMIKQFVRAVQYEVFHLCHPNAHQKHQEGYKSMKNCHNTVWPVIHNCSSDLRWNMTIAMNQEKLDRARFCCAHIDYTTCIIGASKDPVCDGNQKRWFEEVIQFYRGPIADFVCSGKSVTQDLATCKALPPVPQIGPDPLTFLEMYLKIAGYSPRC